MLTFAAVCPAAAVGSRVSAWSEGQFVHIEDRLVGPVLADGWVLLAICGAAIRSFAEERASAFIGGRVIELDTQYWPGKAQVEDALRELGLATAGLVAITEGARGARRRDQAGANPYPEGSVEAIAYSIGLDMAGYATVAKRPDGQEFGICDIGDGEYQSIVPVDLAEEGKGKCHTSLLDALVYLRELMQETNLDAAQQGAPACI